MNRTTKITSGIVAFVLFISSFTPVFSVERGFNINLSVTNGGDVTPPSTPAGLSATAVSTSQIDLVWSASTDNIGVTGYRVYRDNSFVTSVAATSYSDIGLSSGTTYSYTVSAVDAATNESARSATSTATTFTALVPPVQSGGSGSGQYAFPVVYGVESVPEGSGVRVSWLTTVPTVGSLSWGFTSDTELGVIREVVYSTEHSVLISNLDAGTRYFGAITAKSGYGIESRPYAFNFISGQIAEGQANPTNLTSVALSRSILLKWNNPSENAFDEVRLVRSTSFYPSDPFDGETVYEGRAAVYEDKNVEIGKRYYYALFAKGKNGEYSSGIVTNNLIALPGQTEEGVDVIDALPVATKVHQLINALRFVDFDFIQDGTRLAGSGADAVMIDGTKNLTISLDYGKVPEVLKSILITLEHPQNPGKTFSFLLRVNKEKSSYSATIAPLGDSGKYGVRIAVVDYKNQGLKKLTGSLFAGVIQSLNDRECSTAQTAREIFVDSFIKIVYIALIALVALKGLKMFLEKKKVPQEVPPTV
jgi:fibronectin type 3 domain-containing protein